MEVDKRSRSTSKTKEKEKTKDESKSRKSIERPKIDGNKSKSDMVKNGDEKKKDIKTKSAEIESQADKKNKKIKEDDQKKKSKEKSEEKKSKKNDAVAPINEKPKPTKPKEEKEKPKKSSSDATRNRDSTPVRTTQPPEPPSTKKVIKEKVSSRPPSSAKGKRGSIGSMDNDGDYNYEDDFEDYDDDFEADESEPEQVKRPDEKAKFDESEDHASDTELNRPQLARGTSSHVDAGNTTDHSDVSTSRAATAASGSSVDTRPRTVQSRINFERAHVTEAQLANYGKLRGRARELLQLIALDTVSYDLLDMAPVRDYEFFMRNFGKSNMVQVQLQTGDDNIEREIQTEEFGSENKWSQHPATDFYGCGGDHAANEDDARTNLKFDGELLNSFRFRRFVERSGALISELMADEYVSQEPSFQNKSSMSFSSTCSTVSLGPLSKRCSVGAVTFSDSQPTVFAIAFQIYESPLEDITGRTLITVWNITHLDAPYKLLVCDGPCQTCCFSPDRLTYVFAGLSDGTLVAWDLQEADILHIQTIPWKNEEITVREPTYDNAFLCKETRDETSPVVVIAALNSTGKATSIQPASATVDSCQLISLHSDGTIRIWTALMTMSKEPSESDLGLRPGGRLKLIQSALLKPPVAALRNLSGDPMFKSNDIEAFCLGWSPDRQSDFYAGTGTGFILHLTRHDSKAGPSVYQPDLEALTDVLSISISSFESSVLLTGCSDGLIRLYKTSYARPLATLSLPSTFKDATISSKTTVRHVQWSPISPYRFYSIHGDTVLATWDLKQDRQSPVNIETLKPLVSFQISSSAALGSGPTNFLALPGKDGTVEIHQLKAEGGKTKYSKSDGAKLLKLIEML